MSGVGLTGLIQPLNGGAFPVFEDINGLGGFRAVTDATARLAIPANSKKVGMQVVQQDTGITYQWNGSVWLIGGTAVQPFTGIYFVNPSFTGIATGSQSNPFTTIAAAFAAAVAQGVTKGIVYTASITENVVFPTTGNWELASFQDMYFGGQAVLTGTVDVTSITATRNLSISNLEITGAVSGSVPAGLGCTLRCTGVGFDSSISLTGPGNRPWALLLVGNALPSGAAGYGGYVSGTIAVKGSVRGFNYSCTGNITTTALVGDIFIELTGCAAGNIAFSCATSQAGAISQILLRDCNVNLSTFAFPNATSINIFITDSKTAQSMFQNGTTAAGSVRAQALQSVSNLGLANNQAVTTLGAKTPYRQLRVSGTLTLVTPGTLGNAVLNITYIDSLGASRTKPVTPILNIAGAAGDEVQGTFLFTQDGSAIIQYSVTGIVTPGALGYNLCIAIEPAS